MRIANGGNASSSVEERLRTTLELFGAPADLKSQI